MDVLHQFAIVYSTVVKVKRGAGAGFRRLAAIYWAAKVVLVKPIVLPRITGDYAVAAQEMSRQLIEGETIQAVPKSEEAMESGG